MLNSWCCTIRERRHTPLILLDSSFRPVQYLGILERLLTSAKTLAWTCFQKPGVFLSEDSSGLTCLRIADTTLCEHSKQSKLAPNYHYHECENNWKVCGKCENWTNNLLSSPQKDHSTNKDFLYIVTVVALEKVKGGFPLDLHILSAPQIFFFRPKHRILSFDLEAYWRTRLQHAHLSTTFE